ncbi:cell division protein ZapA [Kushneria phosphatilytica]|uniref:Cell division protein ZapA n=1 Tax=Kushneria phosphatilytica TaxID=657387 RepID=A0A1S1NSE5_9GAMM|nr:cell division protein ZapA [Kushneria phosphatilytica]OHV08944.1 cell division protein ZapA [Kushneria phosphatilytica]QEL09702.1 cell division protein ZapA [Kushneria phosphatilytica]
MSEGPRQTAEITLMGQTYVVSCAPGEEEELAQAARYLNQAMNGIQSRGRTISIDKVAMMAGLNITHELIREIAARKALEERLAGLAERLEQALDQPARQRNDND